MARADLRELFAREKDRPAKFTVSAGDLTLDYSKNLLMETTRKLLLQLVKEAGVRQSIESMFAGERINTTEDRAVLHVALRAKMSDQVGMEVPGVLDVWRVLDEMESFVGRVHSGEIRGQGGATFSDIVNIGIGGSDLGPVMASRALRPYWRKSMRFHSVSNVDGTQLDDLKSELNPGRTLFVICSKTFTTLETMTNAQAARNWLASELGEDAVSKHFAAASTNHEAMDEFGINPGFRFGFWDWVGGRYSIWSAVGLSLALVIGMDNFKSMLSGARRIDMHFRQAPFDQNLPVLMAAIAIWYNNFYGTESQAILPYTNRLDRFPAYLQQLQMESNGKSTRLDGKLVKATTGQVIWGEAGSNAQHSFYQLLHQGKRLVPVDFILPTSSSGRNHSSQNLAIANCLAQSEALMDGVDAVAVKAELQASGMPARQASALARHKAHAGNRPSSVLMFPSLSPEVLGQLLALYEHKVFVEGAIWGINSFDQFGVELGKQLASGLTEVVSGKRHYEGQNPSTAALLKQL